MKIHIIPILIQFVYILACIRWFKVVPSSIDWSVHGEQYVNASRNVFGISSWAVLYVQENVWKELKRVKIIVEIIAVYLSVWVRDKLASGKSCYFTETTSVVILNHWGRVTHICVSKLTIICSDNGLSPGRRQAITRTNAGILVIGPLRTNFSENVNGIQHFHSRKWVWKCRMGNVGHFDSASTYDMCKMDPYKLRPNTKRSHRIHISCDALFKNEIQLMLSL